MNIRPRTNLAPYFSKPPTPTHKKPSPFSNSVNNSFEPLKLPISNQFMRDKKRSLDRNYKTECLGNSPQGTQRRKETQNVAIYDFEQNDGVQSKDMRSRECKKYERLKGNDQKFMMNKNSQKSSIMTFKKSQDGFYTPRNNNIRKPPSVEWPSSSISRQVSNGCGKKDEKIYELQSILSSQISHRLEQIQSIMDEENINLRQHNQYLIDVIRRLQNQQRMNKTKLMENDRKIHRLNQQNSELRSKVHSLQNHLEHNSFARKNISPSTIKNQWIQDKKSIQPNQGRHKVIDSEDICMKKNKATSYEEMELSISAIEDSTISLKSFIGEIKETENLGNDQKKIRRVTPFFLNKFCQQSFSKQLTTPNGVPGIEKLRIKKSVSSEEEEQQKYQDEDSILESLNIQFEENLAIYKKTSDLEAKEKCIKLLKKIKAMKANDELMRDRIVPHVDLENEKYHGE